jgi:hypothetical protein
MSRVKTYLDLRGEAIDVGSLDVEERRLIDALIARSRKVKDDSASFQNYGLAAVDAFYAGRGLHRREIAKSAGYRIWEDLLARLMIDLGEARAEDYRDELEDLIASRFKSRRAFCEATGISEDMLSHVLNKRKHMAINTLAEALERIGYTLTIAPINGTRKSAAKAR